MPKLPDSPFTIRDWTASGSSRHDLRELVRHGAVRRVLRSVYVDARLPDSIELRAQCAARVLPEHVVVCDRSAAWLHGVEVFDLADLELLPPLEVASISGHSPTRRHGTSGGRRALTAADIVDVHGVAVTSPLRTATDLACLWGRRNALAALNGFLRQHGITRHQLRAILPQYKGRRGVRQLRELIEIASPIPESPGESWTQCAIHDAGLPAPTMQHELHLPGWGDCRLDFAYPLLKIAIEYDGEEHHSSDEDRAADARRRELLEQQGWIVIVVRKDDFTSRRVDAWTDQLRQAITERRPTRNRRYARGEDSSGFSRRA